MSASRITVTIALAGAVFLAGCEGTGGIAGMSREQSMGTAGGAVVGGIAGYAISDSAVGALLGAAAGAVIGNRIGNWLEGDGTKAAAIAAARAAESGETVTWKKTGATFETTQEGWATPAGPAYIASDGRTCRPIRQSATQNGQTREDTVTLCKDATGWVAA